MTNVNSKKLMFPVISIVSVAALLLASGCAKYRGQNLETLAYPSSEAKKESVFMAYKPFNASDCKVYLDRDVLAKGYQPIQVTIVNNSKKYLDFSLDRISLPSVPAREIARKVHTSTAARAGGYGAASLVLWPFIIPAIVDGNKSARANDRLDEDFNRKELKTQIISPYHSVNGIIFVPRERFNPDFKVTLVEVENNNKIELGSTKTSFNF
ncbi:MAG: hypothetical protein SZ59_C0003G0077 [candidate division TM6 bacterium GW2011_GWF2_28_16]|nr:MAG: hypothetical protein SZ59_C0003G0077 [candidate division TM6 bacterium GW2011_GWF2_28_16]